MLRAVLAVLFVAILPATAHAAHVLTVQSSPAAGVSINGVAVNSDGSQQAIAVITPDAVQVQDNARVTLTVPVVASPNAFHHWVITKDGGRQAQPAGDNELVLVADQGVTAEAVYSSSVAYVGAGEAFTTIQAAVSAALASSNHVIVVRDGTWTGSGNCNIDFAGKAVVLCSENGPSACTIDCASGATTPRRAFYFHSGEAAGAAVHGFTIINGAFRTPYSTGQGGGAIYCLNASPTISGNVIRQNTAYAKQGGGLLCEGASCRALITKNTFEANQANGAGTDGAAIACITSSAPTITSNTIRQNVATTSAVHADNASPIIADNNITGHSCTAVSCVNASVQITGNTFSQNYSGGSGGAIACTATSSAKTATISGNVIGRNGALSYGGGIYCDTVTCAITGNIIGFADAAMTTAAYNYASYGSGVGLVNAAGTVSGNTIANNTCPWGGSGGGIYCRGGSPTIADNRIAANTVALGGGIYVESAAATVTRNIITANNGQQGGGLMCNTADSAKFASNIIAGNHVTGRGIGGGIFISECSPAITNNTVAGNTGRAGGIACTGGSPSITNCILWGNGKELVGAAAGYSCIEGGAPGAGNIALDPQFVNRAAGDYHLASWSSCIDAGTDAGVAGTDIDGEPRIMLAHADMGADELEAQSTDRNANNLPDNWELQYFHDLSHSPTTDDDGDGYTNRQEYELGTDPTFSNSPIYVSEAAGIDPAQATGSLTLPFPSIQEALNAAPNCAAGYSVPAIRVAAGTYAEEVMVGKAVSIEGGWNAAFDQCDPRRNATIVDAADVPTAKRVTCRGVTVSGVRSGSISGFTIRGGTAPYGGGISCEDSAIQITGNTITQNSAARLGGGIYCRDCASVTVRRNTIISNSASWDGGGLYFENCGEASQSCSVANNVIVQNHSAGSGGARSIESFVELINNTIADNATGD